MGLNWFVKESCHEMVQATAGGFLPTETLTLYKQQPEVRKGDMDEIYKNILDEDK